MTITEGSERVVMGGGRGGVWGGTKKSATDHTKLANRFYGS